MSLLLKGVARLSQLEIDTDKDWQAKYAHPIWLIKQLRSDWPDHWPSILDANNRQAPLTLRVNRQKITTADFLQHLNLPAETQGDAITLQQATDVTQLPGYDDGWFAVQDAGAQLAAPLLDLHAGQRVLDACAAPGGKTAHLLALQPDIHLLALDISASRLQRVSENLQRLGHHATVMCGDAAQRDWWDGQLFDRILLDAPCSATGVIRRHPDIKSLRHADDIAELAATQQQLLQNLWPMLAPGGLLLYATCSVFRQENEQVVAAFLAQQPDARQLPVILPENSEGQLLPNDQHDGFFYALLRKQRTEDR